MFVVYHVLTEYANSCAIHPPLRKTGAFWHIPVSSDNEVWIPRSYIVSKGDHHEQLVISLKTVRNHVSNIFSKLQVADRAQAIVRARDAGIGREWST